MNDFEFINYYTTTDMGYEERIIDAEFAEAERQAIAAEMAEEAAAEAHSFELPGEPHAVYAYLDTAVGPHRVRVSKPLDWPMAVDLHDALHRNEAGVYVRPASYPGYTVYGRFVCCFVVRSVYDPDWPGLRTAQLFVRDIATGVTLIDR